ncbi:MAG: phosphatidylserine decarboxylase [Hyphomicrobiales bacterium]|nr:phosphatidylserine decarboxylase [Hyphomicrobiales bacterium]
MREYENQSLIDTVLSTFAPVHRDGHKFIGLGALVTLLLFLLWAPLGWLAALITAFIAYFFRDPDRATPLRPGLVVAPADGRIVAVGPRKPLKELGLGEEPMTCVSIFLSMFDVHINRAPLAGRVAAKVYTPGVFFNAASEAASQDNERMALRIEAATGEAVGVVQIAGLVARRIVTFPAEGDMVAAGERIGLIRFGSRVDVYLPLNRGVLAAVGQRCVGGETVLADFQSAETGREVRVS